MFAVWTKGATLNHYPYNIRHRFIGEMERWVGGTWGTRRVSNDSCGECCLRFRQICWVWDPLLSFLLHRFSPLQRSCQSISPSPSLCSLQFLMFYNLVCFGWIKWNFNLDSEFGYVLQVQNLCEWRERQMPLFDLVSLAFLLYFLFWEERDIKFEQKYLFTLAFNKGGLEK